MCVILSLAVYTMNKKKVCYYHSATQYTPQAVTGITPVLNQNHMCRIPEHSGHWLIAATLVEHKNPLKGSSMIYTHLR